MKKKKKKKIIVDCFTLQSTKEVLEKQKVELATQKPKRV